MTIATPPHAGPADEPDAPPTRRIVRHGIDFSGVLLSTGQVAALASTSTRSVERWIDRGAPAWRRPAGRRCYLRAGELLAWALGPGLPAIDPAIHLRLIHALQTANAMSPPGTRTQRRRAAEATRAAPTTAKEMA
jgi:hypothetical protein